MNRFEKWSVWTTSVLTVLTGVAYFVTKYLFSSPDPYSVVGHPWQPYFLKAHILVSPLLLFALGTITVHHVWDHFASGIRWSRRTAILTAVMVIPMVATGYLIQVFTGRGWVRAMAVSHIVFGAVYGAGLLAHTLIIRRGRREESDGSAGRGAGDRPEAGAGRASTRRSPGATGAPVGSGPAAPPTRTARRPGPERDGGDHAVSGLKLSGAEIEE